MRSLISVQKIFRVLKIVFLVLAILMFVAAGLCLLCGLFLAINRDLLLSISGDIISQIGGLGNLAGINASMITNMGIVIIGVALVGAAGGVEFILCYRYCAGEIAEGSPFTYRCADGLNDLGIKILAIEIAGQLIFWTVLRVCGWGEIASINLIPAVIRGLVPILLSKLFRYGADLRAMYGDIPAPPLPPTPPTDQSQL